MKNNAYRGGLMKKTIVSLALLVLIVLNISFALADDWPTFGHDAARSSWALSFAPDYDLYSSAGLTESIALAAGEQVASTPVIKNNMVYIFAGQEDPKFTQFPYFSTAKLYAFDLAKNEKMWETASFALGMFIPKVTPTVSDDGSIICHGGNNTFYCRNALDGTILWSTTDEYGGSFEFSPVISNGKVWATTRGIQHTIYAFNLADGKEILRKEGCPGCARAIYTPALSSGTLYFTGEGSSPSTGGAIVALDENATNFKWSYQIPYGAGAIMDSTPSVHNDKVFVGVENPFGGISGKGYLLALSKKDGALLWKADIPVVGQHFIGSTPAVYANKVIIASRDETQTNYYIFAFNESSGKLLWQSPNIVAPVSGLSIADSKVIVTGGDSRKLNIFDTMKGNLLWEYAASGDVYSTPSIVNGVVYVGTSNGNVEILKSDTTYEGSITLSPLKTTIIDARANSDVVINITPKLTLLTSASGSINISAYLQQTSLTIGVTQLNKYVDITANSAITANMASATIKIYYTDDEIAAAGINESSLKLYAVINGGTLIALANSGVDTVNNYVYGATTTFSSYGAGGNITDSDNDEIADLIDNCIFAANNNQADSDGDGIGDACDNCINSKNGNQADNDKDGKGDVCDDNDDNDTYLDTEDNCAFKENDGQADSDRDGIGDACDNCVNNINEGQSDKDKDGHGDACDICKTIIGAYYDPSSNIKDMSAAIENSIMAKGTKNSLTSKLDGAVSALGRNQFNNSIRKLESFIDEIGRLVKQGKLGNERTYFDLLECTDAIKGQIQQLP